MSETNHARMGVLYQEHVYLGAAFEPSDEGRFMRVAAYPSQARPDAPAPDKAAFLADLTGSTYALASGPHAQDLVEAAFCGRKLAVGECAWECALTAEGALTSVPLVVRTGQNEYALVDPSGRGDVATAWLGFLADIEQGGYAPYAGTKVEDATQMLVPLLMAGNAARAVLNDYVGHPRDLPAPGQVHNVYLDKISAVVAGVPVPGRSLPVFLVLVPPTHAVTLWRSFLSFTEVEPIGSGVILKNEGALLPWGALLAEKDQVKPTKSDLESWALLRPETDFVGARSLK